MSWHKFIFSEEKKDKMIRHFVFWVAWWVYLIFFLQQPLPAVRIQPYYITYSQVPLKALLLVVLYALACYPLMNIVLPKFVNGKWKAGIVYGLAVCSLLLAATYFLYWNIFSLIDSSNEAPGQKKTIPAFWPPVNLGLINFAKIASSALVIKYIKYWWFKQQESLRLEQEIVTTELQLLKAQVHPDFLFKTLSNIHSHSLESSPQTSSMLLKLSDLLSYMLYECDDTLVPLEKELEMMHKYMELEKIRYNNEPEIEVNIKGDLNGQLIAPFLLLPFIEKSFRFYEKMSDQFWINMNIRVHRSHFSMKLSNGIPPDIKEESSILENGIADAQKRLALLYPGKHELKITREQEMAIVLLMINLGEELIDVTEEPLINNYLTEFKPA